MTIHFPAIGETVEAQLEEDEFRMLWLIHRNRRNSGRVQILLSAALQTGWRIVEATAEEQAVLDAHGFRSGEGAVRLGADGHAGVVVPALRTGRWSEPVQSGGRARLWLP